MGPPDKGAERRLGTPMTTAAPAPSTVSDPDFRPGLEGVIAFESEIAEPDKEGGALRYRGVDINDLVGRVSFGQVWGLLVDIMQRDTEKHIAILRFVQQHMASR